MVERKICLTNWGPTDEAKRLYPDRYRPERTRSKDFLFPTIDDVQGRDRREIGLSLFRMAKIAQAAGRGRGQEALEAFFPKKPRQPTAVQEILSGFNIEE